MRKLLIAVGAVLFLILIAVFVVPRLIGTDQLTAFLTERLRGATGYNVAIHGPVALSVLPGPSLSADDIHVTADGATTGTELAHAAGVDIQVALLPLLGGRVEVTAVTVRDPVVTLDGPPAAVKPVAQAPANPLPRSAPAPGAASPEGSKFSVAVRHIRVTNGSFAYRDGGRAYGLDHLDLDLTTSADGTIMGSADTGFDGDKLHVVGRVGSIDCAKPIPLSFHATAETGAATLDFDGTASCGDDRHAAGKLKFAALSARAALAPFTRAALPPALDQRVAFDGTLAADPGKAELTDLSLDLDRTHGAGSVTARAGAEPSIDLALDLNRLELDPWLEKPSVAPAQVAPSPSAPAAGTAGPSVAATAPVVFHVGLDLSAELMSWRGGLIRQARFNGGIDRGTITINQATAELPGGTDLSVSGQVVDAFDQGHFTGTLDAETDNLRALFDWAGVTLGSVPADRLRQASLSGSLDLGGDRASATDVEFDLDGSRFRGAANLVLSDRPAIGLRLAGDQLNLDAYLAGAPGADIPTSSPAAAPTDASAGPPVPVAAAALLLPMLAANLDLSFDTVTWRGQLLKGVHLAGDVANGVVTVGDARIADLGGGTVALAGRWSGGVGPAAALAGHLSASGPSAVPLMGLLGLGAQETAARIGAFGLDLHLAGVPAALDVDGTLSAADGRLAAKGRLGLGATPHFAGQVTLDDPEATRLLALLAPTYRPAGGTLGPVALRTTLDATPDRAKLDPLSLTIGSQRLEGTVRLDGADRPVRLDADLTGGELVLDPFLPVHEVAGIETPVRYAALGDPEPLPGRWSRAKLDFSWLGVIDATVKLSADGASIGPWRLDKPRLAFGLKGGTLGLDTLTGGLFGGTLDAHGSLSRAPALALTISGRDLDLKDLAQHLGSGALTAGTGALDADLTTAGGSEAELIQGLGGKATLAARNGTAIGFDLGAVNDRLRALKGPQDLLGVIQAVQAGGNTRFSALDATATIANGVARSTDLHLVADGGDLTGRATADLPAWTIDGQVALALGGRADLPPIAVSFSGPLDRPEKRIDVKSLAAYVEGRSVGSVLQGLTGLEPAAPTSLPKPVQPLQDLVKGLFSKP